MDKRYVCHISGQGEKWEVVGEDSQRWHTPYVPVCELCLYLPKSEYRLCDTPERWVDVTEQCKVSPLAGSELSHGDVKVYFPMGYRFRKVRAYIDEFNQDLGRKVESYAFIVERKEQP